MKLFRSLSKKLAPQQQRGYSQFGEDLILSHFFAQQNITKPTYLDIGANEPRYISNTYFFYLRGSKGVLIEPNPFLVKKLKATRPRDVILNTGIGFSEVAEADFYVFPDYANGLSTFSEKEARHWEEVGMKGLGKIPVEKVLKMPLVPANKVLQEYFSSKGPDLISLDVEGLDLQILQSMDLDKFKPGAICVETVSYDDQQKGYKMQDIISYMTSVGYIVYADTYVNTIFCRKEYL